MGELGFLGLDKPEEYGGQGGDYYSALVLAEEIGHANSGGLAMGVAVQTDMAMPPILAFGTEEQKRQWVVPAIAGTKILCLGITEPDAGCDVKGIKTHAVKDGDEYVINGSKTYITNGHRADVIVLVTKTDPDAGYDGFTLFLVPMDAPGVIREKKLKKIGMHASDTALLAFQDVRVPESAVLGQVGGLLPHHVGAPGRAADRRRRDASRAHRGVRPHARIRQRAHRVRPRDRQLPGDPPQVRRDGDQDRDRPPDGVHDRVAPSTTASTPCARSRWPSCTRRGSPARSPTSASRSTAAPATCASTASSASWRDMRLNRIGAGTDEIMLEVIGRSYGRRGRAACGPLVPDGGCAVGPTGT